MPPDSSCGKAVSQPLRPTSARRSFGERAPGKALPPPTSSGKVTFSNTLRHGRSAASWKTKPISRLRRAISGTSPSTAMRPLLGAIRSAITRRSVDFPQPEGPSNVRKLPRGIVRSIFSSAVTVPRSVVKRTVTRSQATASALAAGAGSLRASATAMFASADLGARALGGVKDLGGHDVLELGRAGGELFQLVVQLDLLLPDRRIEGAPAVGLGVGVEGEGEQHLAALDLVGER